MFNSLKKGIAIGGAALALGAGGLTADVALETQKGIDALPMNEKLVVDKMEIIASSTKEYIVDGRNVVKYVFKGTEVLVKKDEIVSERTDKVRVFAKGNGEREMRVYSPGSFTEEGGVWYEINSATTTKAAFDLQTKSVSEQVVDKMIEAIEPILPQKAEASVQTVFETKDTYYGTAFGTGGNPDATTIWYGGWGDFYYGFLEWDLTGTPTSAQTSAAQVCFKVETLATNWAQMAVHRITGSWTEAGVTSTNIPTYTTDGAVTMTTAAADETYHCTTITTLYEGWKDGTYSNYGIRLHSGYNTDSRGAYYSEDQTGTDSDPYLSITYLANSCDVSSDNNDWEAQLADNCTVTNYIEKNGVLSCYGTGSFTIANGGTVVAGLSACPQIQVKNGGMLVVRPIRMLEQQTSLYYAAWRMPDQYHGFGQTFQATSTAPLDWIYAYIRKTGAPTGTVYIKVYNMTSATSGLGSNIATISLDAATQISSGSYYYTLSFTGANRVKLIQGNWYLWTIEFSGTGDVSNYITTGMSQTNVQANNNLFLKSTLDVWSYSTSYDLVYKLWGKYFVN